MQICLIISHLYQNVDFRYNVTILILKRSKKKRWQQWKYQHITYYLNVEQIFSIHLIHVRIDNNEKDRHTLQHCLIQLLKVDVLVLMVTLCTYTFFQFLQICRIWHKHKLLLTLIEYISYHLKKNIYTKVTPMAWYIKKNSSVSHAWYLKDFNKRPLIKLKIRIQVR